MKAALLNRISLVLSAIGLFIAGLLSLEKALGLQLPCGTGNECATVSNHSSGYWLGIPVANFGAGGYFMLLLLALFRTTASPKEFGGLVKFGALISGIGAGLSLYLQYVSLAVLQAKCIYCIASAILMVLLFVVHIMLVREPLPTAPEEGASAPEFYYGGRKDQLLGIGLGLLACVAIGVTLSNVKGLVSGTAIIGKDTAASIQLVPDKPNTYGPADAPITVVEFADLSCASCIQMGPRIKEFIDKYPGKVKLVYRHFPLEQIHPYASLQAAVSEYAAESGKFWNFVDAMHQISEGQAAQNADQIRAAATAAGLDVDVMTKRLDDPADPIWKRIEADRKVVDALGIDSTPTFVVLAEGKQPTVAKVGAIFELLLSDTYKEILAPN